MQCWQGDEALIDSMLSGAMFPLLSSGAGMGKIGKALTDVEAAVLDHSLRGHPSLQRMVVSSKATTVNGLKLTAEGVRQLAILGCDHCNALKIKLVQPKENVQPGDVPEGQAIRIIMYDSFGVVPWPSAQYGFQHAHMYGSKSKKVYWLKGSKTLDEKVVVDLHTLMKAELEVYFPGELVRIVRMDSFSSNRGKAMRQWFIDAVVHGQFSPPGQHAFLGDLERMWYIIFVRALIALRQGKASKAHWFSAMRDALDKECALANKISGDSPTCGYERALGAKHDVSDLYPFFAPGRGSRSIKARCRISGRSVLVQVFGLAGIFRLS
jgi:hypothetical protein